MGGISRTHAKTIVELMRAKAESTRRLAELWKRDPEHQESSSAKMDEASVWESAAEIVEEAIDDWES